MELILTGVIIIAAFWILALHGENKSKQVRIDRLLRDNDQNDLLYNKLNSKYIELHELYKQMKAEIEETLNDIRDAKS